MKVDINAVHWGAFVRALQIIIAEQQAEINWRQHQLNHVPGPGAFRLRGDIVCDAEGQIWLKDPHDVEHLYREDRSEQRRLDDIPRPLRVGPQVERPEYWEPCEPGSKDDLVAKHQAAIATYQQTIQQLIELTRLHRERIETWALLYARKHADERIALAELRRAHQWAPLHGWTDTTDGSELATLFETPLNPSLRAILSESLVVRHALNTWLLTLAQALQPTVRRVPSVPPQAPSPTARPSQG